MEKKKVKRKLIINKEFQYKFGLYLIVPVLLSLSIFWIGLELFFSRMNALGQASSLPVDHPFYTFIKIQKTDLSQSILVAGILISIVMLIWGLYVSRRIVGPIKKLQIHLDAINNQDDLAKELELRKADFFQEIPLALNEMVKRIKK